MKKLNFLKSFFGTMLVLAATAFTGCVDDNDDTELPYLEVTPATLSFDANGDPTNGTDGKVTVKTNRPWQLTFGDDSEWAYPSATEGNGSAEVTFDIPQNKEGRVATLTFSLSNSYGVYLSKDLTITQGEVVPTELILDENFGTAGTSAAPYPTVAEYTGWSKLGEGASTVEYAGTNAQLRNSSPSNNSFSGYAGSGGSNLYFSAAPNDFIVKDITLPEEITTFQLTFGAYIYNPATVDPYYSTYSVMLSADGTKWTDPVPFEVTFVDSKSWNLATSNFKLEKHYDKLFIKISAAEGNNRIDDVKLYTGNGGTNVNLETGAVDAELKVTTKKPMAVSATGATLAGSINAVANVTEVGFQYTANADNINWDAVAKTPADAVEASFTKAVTGLTRGTVYAVRAYATGAEGDTYGDVVTFTAEDVEIELSCAGLMAYIKGLEVASGAKADLSDFVGKNFDAYIAANNEDGNLPGMLVVVDNTGAASSGVLLYGSKYNTFADYPVGAKINIAVTAESQVSNYYGVLEVMDVTETVDKNTTATMKVPEITAAQLNSQEYCYMHVKVKDLTYPGTIGDAWYSGTSGGFNRTFTSGGENVIVRTTKTASFKDAKITSAGPAAISGVPQQNFYQDKTTVQFFPATAADVAAFSAGATEPGVTTGAATSVTGTGATLAGSSQNIENATEVGVKYTEYAENINWANVSTKVAASAVSNSWTVNVTGLTAGKRYAYAAYAVTPSSTLYGDAKSFTTESGDAATITTDFMALASYPADFPIKDNKKFAAEAFDFSGTTYTLFGSESGGYYRGKVYEKEDYYLMIGKKDAYVELPAIAGKSLTKVKCTVPAAASGNVTVGVFDGSGVAVSGGEAVKWAKENDTDTRYYTYNLSGAAQNTSYRLLITNEYNAQLFKLELWYSDGGATAEPSLTVNPTSLSFTADADNTGKVIDCTIAHADGLQLYAKSSDNTQFPTTVSGTKVTVKALENTTTQAKNATVTVYLADSENGTQVSPKTVAIAQAGKSGGSTGGSTTLDFSSANVSTPALPTSKTTNTAVYAIGGVNYTISASGAGSYYFIDGSAWGNPEPNKGLYLKEGYVEVPAIAGKSLVSITATSTTDMGGGVTLSVTDATGTTVVAAESFTKASPLTLAFEGAANTAYRLVVAAGNAQIAKLELVYSEGGSTPVPNITSVSPEALNWAAAETAAKTVTVNGTDLDGKLSATSSAGVNSKFGISVNGTSVTVTPKGANDTSADFDETLTIAAAGGNSKTVALKQAKPEAVAAPEITTVDPTSVSFTAAGGSKSIAVTVKNQNGKALSVSGLTVPFGATVSGNTVTVTANANTGDAVSQTLTISVEGGNNKTVPVTMEAMQSGGDVPAAGTVLWAENWASYGSSSTTFTANLPIGDYDYAGQTLYNPNSESYAVTYTADANNNVRATTSTASNVEGGNLWFNKSAEGVFTTSAIKLYGATSLVFSHAQGTSGSALATSYSTDGTNWTELGTQSGAIAAKSYNFTVPAGTETVYIRLSHPASNAKNTRGDNFELKVGE